ncbi:hypothetical protein FRC09_015834 [Ceratobasidium sp. 395]|nr:hypothetical protein FRC09_015834 [Ceratobasidium sp. 395]
MTVFWVITSISHLISAPPGYVRYNSGGQLTKYVRRKPYSIVLIDKIEKASREFVTLFLQVLDESRLMDGEGRVVDFKNTVVIMTSNLGAAHLKDLGDKGEIDFKARQAVMKAIESHFPPEFVNRIGQTVIFIIEVQLAEVQQHLVGRGIKLVFQLEAKDHLSRVGYVPEGGARLLNRVIEKELLNPLPHLILEEPIHDGYTVTVSFNTAGGALHIGTQHEELG